jgi:WD40 repeat protein
VQPFLWSLYSALNRSDLVEVFMSIKIRKLLVATSVLTVAILACVLQSGTTPGITNVETVVAQTMQALTPGGVNPGTASAPTSPGGDLFPHSLYFLNNDSAGLLQIYRLEADGTTLRQISFEPGNVESYDVSTVDGRVAYSSNNQLLLVNADGSDRRVLVDGGPLGSEESYFTSRVGGVAWSPGGDTIAFGYGGLNFFALSSGSVNKVLDNIIDTTPGFPVLRESYGPVRFAPSGGKLLINIGYYEGGVYALYYLSGSTLVRTPDNPVSCCDGSWAPDGSAYYLASPYIGMISPGLWRLDADGTVVALLSSDFSPGSPVHFAKAPILGPDGQLYFFYNSLTTVEEVESRVPLYMVRSGPDGVTGRTNIIPTPFEQVNEILWSPDASFAILAIAPVPDVYQGGQAEVIYTDGRPAITLVPFARDMRWGP